MKVVAFNGSSRKDGNTAMMIRWVFEELEAEGVETELIQGLTNKINPCIACYKCGQAKDRRCQVEGDQANQYIAKMAEADGIILGSPVYFANATPQIRALIDRCGFVGRANGGMFRRKVGAAVVVARRAGMVNTFNTLNHFFFISEMIVPGSSYWNLGHGLNKGDVEKDQEAQATMRTLGQSMAWLMKKIAD